MSEDLYTGVDRGTSAEEPPAQIGSWRITALLGTGATADVFAVEHVRSGRVGALKRLRPGVRRERFRNELLGLGVLELPGVVRILDDGLHAGTPYLVEERIDGTPFPGTPSPSTWEAFSERAVSLLLALERLHAAGIFHLDLKPSNALVDALGRVTLVDLGLCQGPALGERPAPDLIAAGTLSTIAPEQLAGESVDGRSDLFAVGRMLAAWASRHDYPRHVSDAIRVLCAADPHERPATARDALRLLKLDPVRLLRVPVIANGPERLLRVQSGVASALEGHVLADVVRDWVCAGDAVIESDGTITMTVLGRRRLHGQAALAADPAALESLARTYEEAGALTLACRALGMLATHARWQRWDGREPLLSEPDILARWLSAALKLESPEEIERVGYAVARVPDAPNDLVRVARAAVSFVRGRPDEAVPLLAHPTSDSVLEAVRHRVRVQSTASGPEPNHLATLDEAEAWASTVDEETRGQVAGWRAHMHYRAGRYANAAVLHERAIEGDVRGPRCVSAALNAASCWMEIGAHERALTLARAGLHEADRLHHDVLVVRAEWLLRSISYRDGQAAYIDDELVDAAAYIESPLWRGLVRLGEAVIAWRAADSRCTTLARSAHDDLVVAGLGRVALLAHALVAVSTRDDDAARAVLASVEPGGSPSDDLTWQILGVMHMHRLLDHEESVHALQLAHRASDPGRRREVLAPREVTSVR